MSTNAGGWCAPAETIIWCGHRLSDGCECEIKLDPVTEDTELGQPALSSWSPEPWELS